MSNLKKLFLVSGEISGDEHGAALMKALPDLDSSWELSGLGGPKMAAISGEIENWLDEAAVLGLWEVLKKYSYFSRKMAETVRRIEESEPDGVVLIDYPGFNLRLAKRLRDGGYKGKLIYYISPQVWAWKRGRIKTMAELLDLMICIFPFEKELYEESGLPTVFAGHPLVDSLEEIRRDDIEREEGVIALLPGSREREISALFPQMLGSAVLLLKKYPGLQFETSGATPILTEKLQSMVDDVGLSEQVSVGLSTSREIMQRASVGVVASGTATLEAACLGLPYCLTYRVAWLTAVAARWLMSVDFLGIVNVIAGREVVKELLQNDATAGAIREELERLLTDRKAREALQVELSKISVELGGGGAHANAANALAASLSEAEA